MKHLLLYDGHCLLCNRWVRKTLLRDKGHLLKVAAVQHYLDSEAQKQRPVRMDVDSIIFIEPDQITYRSTAALRAVRLVARYPLWYSFLLLIPRQLRDFFYGIIARNRYQWWGRSDACILPSPDLRDRYLSSAGDITEWLEGLGSDD